MNRADWLVAALGAAKSRPLSPVQIQKTMFLMGQEAKSYVDEAKFYHFEPYDYGPFSSSIYSDLERLQAEGKVRVVEIPGRRWSAYSLTPEGTQAANAIAKEANPKAVRYLETVVDWISRQSFQQLVGAIYEKYPAYKANSVFRG